MSSVDGLQYWALYEYKKDREEDLALCPGDLLMVNRAGLACMDYKEGDERNPQGWLNGFNECTKEWGDFPGTYVEYLGPVRIVATMPKSRPRPLPPAPTETSSSHLWGPPGQIEFVDQLNLPEQALLVVKRLIEALEKEGLDNEALYRSPPTSFCDPQLKQILLKETQTPEECGQQIKVILESACLPQWHRLLLQHLTRHFCKLCQNGSRNHLTPRVLGEALSEVLFKPSPSSMEVNPEHRVKIIEALIVVGGVSEIQAAPDSCCQIGLG
ncbi:phosphatidylinositol 3-kinase regulatory subunit alpha-like isoform X2 [Rhineura floridana]|uniref:phosphatidylinositol 3-kinase regulatory subunit alpha-like isoform X2 n=1 Tax=Rhineura floridana TaxID=261503 RepID=UPI002AC85895|nr:phosphatidylinositol 3-kinase regulatory subunit alpha-like isoform X2 [Rhineura floridana]